MYRNLLNWLTILLVLPSCSGTSPTISVVCEENNVGNAIIKWETAPILKGQVKVYASTSPDFIPEENPVATINIAKGKKTIVTNDPSQRYYYLMVFNNKNMGIRTIIDLRSEEERHNYPQFHDEDFNVLHLPIATGNMEHILQDIRDKKIETDTIYRLVERMNRQLVTNYRKEYKELFTLLLDRNNYPVVIHCTSGKGRTGIVSALVLAALGVNEEAIMKDYRLSNDYFNIPKASRYAYKLPINSQEAITTIYSAKEDFLNAAKEQIDAEYGSVQAYLKKGIGLSAEEIERLRSILLIDNG